MVRAETSVIDCTDGRRGGTLSCRDDVPLALDCAEFLCRGYGYAYADFS